MSFIVVLGEFESIMQVKEQLKTRLSFKFDWTHKVWFRPVEQDKFTAWQRAVADLSQELECCWVASMNHVPALRRAAREEAPKAEVPALQDHAYDGAVFEMSAWWSRRFRDDKAIGFVFRNFKILKVKRETEKAFQVDAKFFSGICSSCGVCGRMLDNDISRATGIGPVCAGRLGLPRPTMETAKEIVAQMEAMSQAHGVFHDVWIPKSQIKRINKDGQTTEGEAANEAADPEVKEA